MRKVLRKVKSQWVVLGVMGATVVSLGTANIQKVSAAETEGTGTIETIEQTGSTVVPDEPITILEEETITEEVVDSNLDEGGTTTPKGEIIAMGTNDVTAPVIDGSSISLVKTSVTQGESINVSVNITDDSGIASASMNYLSPITGESETIALYKNEMSGLFEGAFTVTDATELGVWECSSIAAYDTQGNSALLVGSDADLSGAVFTVNEKTDAAKLVLQASSSVEGLQAGVASEEVTGLSATVVAATEVQETPVVNLAAEGTVSTSVPFDNLAYATNTQTGNAAEYARGTSGVQWVQVDLGASYDLNEIQLWHYYGDGRSYRDVIVQLSNDATFANGAVTVFNNDTNGSAGLGVGTDSEYSETSAGKTIAFDTLNARYARFYSNGSTVNGANHYVEIEVYGMEPQTLPTTNLVPGGTISSSVSFDNLPYAANTKADNTAEYARGTSGLQWVQADLGASYELNEIQLWHYFGDGRSYHDVVVQLSDDATFSSGIVTVFNNDTNGSAGLGVGTDSEYSETSTGKKILFDTVTARYARFYSNGSTVNGANHYVEIEVYGVEPQTSPIVNLVTEATLSSSVPFDNSAFATDAQADNTAEYARGTSGLQWMQVDLGAAYDLNEIQLWHYYGDGRSYHDVVLQLSNDATFSNGIVTVFNNDTDGGAGLGVGTDSEYSETGAGKTIVFDTVTARYARFYSNGSTVNGANHYVEIQVYGVEPQTVPTVNLAPEGTISSSVPFDNSASATDKLADDTADYARGTSGLQWMQVDLGAAYDLNEIQLWHYFGDGRSYRDVVVQLSNDANFLSGAVTVFNNDKDGSAGLGVGTDNEYSETSAGKKIAFNAVNARYARFYSNGSTVNGANHYVEIEVYGSEPLITTETRTETVIENTVSYTRIEQLDNTLPNGERQLVQVGLDGYDTITYEVTYTNGVETSRAEMSRITLRPVSEVTLIGPPSTDDITNPVIDAASVKVSSNTATLGESVVISVAVSDDKDLSSVYALFKIGSGASSMNEEVELHINNTTKLFEGAFNIIDSTALGIWQFAAIKASDTSGNIGSLFSTSVYDYWGPSLMLVPHANLSYANIEVTTEVADITEPVIGAVKVSSNTVTSGESVTVSVVVSDDRGIPSSNLVDHHTSFIRAVYISPVTNSYKFVPLYKNYMTGLFEGTLDITDASEVGTWTLYFIDAYDTSHNWSILYNSNAAKYFESPGTDLSSADFTVQ